MGNKKLFSKLFESGRILPIVILPLVLCITLLTGTNYSFGEENILTFYNKAEAKIKTPPDEAYLEVICRKKIDNMYVTFIGLEDDKVLLAAITEKKLKHPDKDILLTVRFSKLAVLPTRDYVVDFGYVYDRNSDGKIDYISYLIGPMPFKDKVVTTKYPKLGEPINAKELEIVLHGMDLFFTHWADDNYDGKVDALVIEALDPENGWVEGRMAVRSTKFDGAVDEAWFFKEDINIKEKDAERVGNGFRTRSMMYGIGYVFGPADLDKTNYALSMFNQAAEKCKLTSSSFYRP